MSQNTLALSNTQSDRNSLTQQDEEILFAEETELVSSEKSRKILIVDDENEVHEVTKLALSDFTFEERSLVFISAYSAQEAKRILQELPNIAIIF